MKPSQSKPNTNSVSNKSISVKHLSTKSNSSPRTRILVKASQLFYNQGYQATGINQIIQESKSAKASFYDHYPSKEILGKEVIRRYAIQVLLWFRALLRSSKSPENFIDNLEKAVILQTKSKEAIYQGCPIAIFSTQFPKNDPLFSKEFAKAVYDWEKLFLKFFQKMKDQKLIPNHFDSIAVARSWIQFYEGSLITWRMSNDNNYISSMKSSMLTIYQFHKKTSQSKLR